MQIRVALRVGGEQIQRYANTAIEANEILEEIINSAVTTGRYREGVYLKNGVSVITVKALFRMDGCPMGFTIAKSKPKSHDILVKLRKGDEDIKKYFRFRECDEVSFELAYSNAVAFMVSSFSLNDNQRSHLVGAYDAFRLKHAGLVVAQRGEA